MAQKEVLQEIAGQVADCKRCQLSYSRKKAVPGEGPAKAEIMLIGEGPGFYENEQGRPFIGPAGKFLDELLEKAGVSRKEVFITNVVKCRPPGNRDPENPELQACSEYLDRQIAAINPLIIITLGRYSMAKFLYNAKISDVHGRPVWARGRMIIPMFHPAAALHQPSLKTSVEQDFARVPDMIRQARQNGSRPAAGSEPIAGQELPAHQAAEVSASYAAQPLVPGAAAAPDLDAGSKHSEPAPQASLFDDLFKEEPPEEKQPEESDQDSRNDQPTQLSLF